MFDCTDDQFIVVFSRLNSHCFERIKMNNIALIKYIIFREIIIQIAENECIRDLIIPVIWILFYIFL